MTDRLIVWDFDGVLNANVVDGHFVWADNLHADWGIDRDAFVQHLFQSGQMQHVVRGQIDLLDVVSDWFISTGHDLDPEAFLAYWFEQDALPDREVIGLMTSSAGRHVIGTNNEARRASFIETQMGFTDCVEHVFASGRMSCAKPDDAFFQPIERWSNLPPAQHVLIDDTTKNVEAAQRRGWAGFHFTDASRSTLAGFLARAS